MKRKNLTNKKGVYTTPVLGKPRAFYHDTLETVDNLTPEEFMVLQALMNRAGKKHAGLTATELQRLTGITAKRCVHLLRSIKRKGVTALSRELMCVTSLKSTWGNDVIKIYTLSPNYPAKVGITRKVLRRK